MKNKNFIGRLRCLLFLMALASFNYLSAQTGPNDDFDGDGIINSIDIDDDNDGILDTAEGVSFSNNTIVNGNFGTDTATGGNLTGWTTNGSGANLTTSFNWFATSGAAASFADGVEGINLSQNITLKTAATLYTSIFTVKVLGLNGSGVGLANGWGKMSFWIQGTAGLVKLFTVYNPQTANLNSPTSDIIEINSTVVKKLSINGNSSASSFANGSYSTIQLTLDTSQLATTGQILILRSNGAANGPNGQVGADDFFIDDLSYQYEYGIDTDNSGIQNQFNLDSDGDGCSDALEGGATNSVTPNYKFTGPVGANGLDNTLETGDNGVINYTSTYNIYAINSSINACTDTDGDGIRDVIDIDDDNDGVLDTIEQSCVSAGYNTNASNNIPNVFSQYGIVSGNTLFTQLASSVGLIFSDSSSFTSGMLMGNACGEPAIMAGGSWGSDMWFKSVDPTNISRAVPLKSISFKLDCASASPEYSGYTAYDNNGNVLYSKTLTGPTASNERFDLVMDPAYNVYSIKVTRNANAAVLIGISLKEGFGITLCDQDIDTDGDGIPNRLDLDSDGDGCPDALEAGVSSNSGASASMSTSGGAIYTGGIPSGTANAYVGNGTASQYGSNGLFNDIETGENGIYNSAYTYQYAVGKNYSLCKDTDGDGVNDVVDIDDDNDGIVDAVESPTCFYTAAEMAIPNSITSEIPTTDIVANLYDNNIATTFAFTATTATNAKQKTVFEITPKLPVVATSIVLKTNAATTSIFGALATTTAILKAQGWNGTTWVDLATYTTAPSIAANLQTFAFTNTTVYSKYRLYDDGTTGVNITAGVLQEVGLGVPATYIPSANPKLICINDTDGDLIPNHLDLDSDGDGCPDTRETGVSSNAGALGFMSTSGGSIYTGGIPSGTANAYIGNGTPSQYGTNGFFNGIETVADNSVYNGTYLYQYAINSALNACIDTDGDGVGDLIDLDDDNDGVLDILEQNCPNGSKTGVIVTKPAAITYTFTGSQTLANLVDGVDSSALVMITPSGTLNNAEWFRVEFPTARILSSWEVGHFAGQTLFSTTSTYKVQGSNDASIWTDLTGTLTYSRTQNGQSTQTNNSNVADFSSNLTAYKYYRYFGISGATGGGWATEFYFKDGACIDIDTDGDTIPNRLDLDSDGDGCPDALEAGVSVNAGAFTSMSASGGSIYTGGIPSGTANAYVGTGTPSQYGANGFFNGIETAVDSGIYNGSYTYLLYALSLAQNVCTDTDGDNVPDVFDLDDDNDGVLDVVECPTIFSNMAAGGGFSVDAAALPDWYMGLTSTPLPIAEPFTPSVYNITNTGSVSNYGIGGGNQTNSTLTGGLFDILGGVNAATGIQYALQEGDPQRPVVNKLSSPLVAGVPYGYSFDLGNRAAGSTTKYIVMLYNADTKMPEKIIETGALNTIPAVGATPSYKNFTGSFTPAASANYYLLFYPSISGNTESDFVIDRIAVAGAGAGACDIDNDGIPNYLDLDSDGDGCPDTKEAILYNHITEASMPGTVQNGSGGVVTSTTPNVANAMVPGPYGNNGFADALQSASNPNAYKYVYTYNFVADNMNVSTCDNKFLYDIDSDDDGIPDAVESPSCFYTEVQAMDITEGVTSGFDWGTANPLSNTYDNNTTFGSVVAPATNIQNRSLITFNLPVIDATFIDYVQLNVGATAFGAGTWRLEGLDMSTNVWVSLSAAQAMNSANSNYVFTNTLQPNTRYYTYRILGVTSTNITNNAVLTEFSIHYKNYNPSFHRTKMGCNSDGDNDGVPDYLDRDSDGDGCPDAVEAGIDKSLLLPSGFYNNGGTVNGDYVIVGGNYGNNGISDLVETTPDSGIVNYASTYHLYANNAAVNFCTDTDNDSIPDPIDIDDDNDGVLDAVESPSCFYTAAEANVIYRINSQFASPDDDQSDRDIQMLHDGSTTANFNFNAFTVAENVTGSNLFTVEYYTPVRLATLVVSNRISTTANANAVVVGSQDGIMWSAALTPATLITAANATTPITFTITTAIPYKFYKIQTGSVPGALATANTIGEITSTVASGYIPSAHPKSEVCLVDTDGDLIPNHLDNDSDNDGCSDAFEAGTVTYASANGGTFSAGTLNNPSSTLSPNATIGSNTPADYGANGFYNVLETSGNGVYLGTYTYANAINASVASCSLACYKPAITAGTVLDTKQGITSLQRAGTDNSNWPMVRKGAWTVLESKTKGFVPNRLTAQQITGIPAANLREGMMVYHIGLDCLYINTDGTPTGWKCFNTQTCP